MGKAMTTTKRQTKAEREAAERAEARDRLREMFPAGSTVPTVLRHVSSSGMTRAISVLHGTGGDVEDVSWLVARALGEKIDPRHGGIKVGGCGMDMGSHLVWNLSYALYGGGYTCTGRGEGIRWCPSNVHVNPGPERDAYGPGVTHTDGYALRQRWV